jgi:hypothetical protein
VPPLPGFRTNGSPEARRRILLVLFPSAELGFQASQPPPDFDLIAVGLSGLAKRAALRRRSFSIFPPAGAPSECPSLSVSHEARRSPCPVLDRRSTARPRSSFNRGAPCFFHTYPGFCAGLIFFGSVEARTAAAALSRSPVCAPSLSGDWFPLLFSFLQARFRRHR